MGWCDDPASKKYNKLISYPFDYSSEKLYRNDNLYDIIFILNYNTNPVRKNKGSAIFIHVARKKYKYTKGCVAVKKIHLLKLAEDIKKNTEIKII